jgi:hypothetical protein
MFSFFSNFSISTFIASLVGSGATAWLVVKGLSGHLADRWLVKYKANLDKEFESYRDTLEQKRKRLEAELAHQVYMTQAQFDTEFNATKDIFAALGKLKLTFNGLRPDFTWGPTDEKAKREGLKTRLDEFKDRYNALVSVAESSHWFIPENLYEQIFQCMKAAQIEVMHIETAGSKTFDQDWYLDGSKQREKFSDAYFKASKLARERFKSVAVISQ